MSDEEEIVIVGKNVYKAALELLQTAEDTKEDSAALVTTLIEGCKKKEDEEARYFWTQVQLFIERTGVKKAEELLPSFLNDTTH